MSTGEPERRERDTLPTGQVSAFLERQCKLGRDVEHSASFEYYRHRLGRLFPDDDERSFVYYRCLLSRDLFDRLAEILLMIEIDSGDRGDLRIRCSGCIETAAESGLEYRQLDFSLRQMREGRSR
jgi:hypothetical protein